MKPETNHSEHREEDDPSVSPEVVRRAKQALFLGEIESPDAYALEKGHCGDALEVYLTIHHDHIQKARFDSLGCGFTVACGDIAMEMAEGQSLTRALQISPQEISLSLGGLPSSHVHCAELAAQTLRKAILNFLPRKGDPWKKAYETR